MLCGNTSLLTLITTHHMSGGDLHCRWRLYCKAKSTPCHSKMNRCEIWRSPATSTHYTYCVDLLKHKTGNKMHKFRVMGRSLDFTPAIVRFRHCSLILATVFYSICSWTATVDLNISVYILITYYSGSRSIKWRHNRKKWYCIDIVSSIIFSIKPAYIKFIFSLSLFSHIKTNISLLTAQSLEMFLIWKLYLRMQTMC